MDCRTGAIYIYSREFLSSRLVLSRVAHKAALKSLLSTLLACHQPTIFMPVCGFEPVRVRRDEGPDTRQKITHKSYRYGSSCASLPYLDHESGTHEIHVSDRRIVATDVLRILPLLDVPCAHFSLASARLDFAVS